MRSTAWSPSEQRVGAGLRPARPKDKARIEKGDPRGPPFFRRQHPEGASGAGVTPAYFSSTIFLVMFVPPASIL